VKLSFVQVTEKPTGGSSGSVFIWALYLRFQSGMAIAMERHSSSATIAGVFAVAPALPTRKFSRTQNYVLQQRWQVSFETQTQRDKQQLLPNGLVCVSQSGFYLKFKLFLWYPVIIG